MPVSIDDVAVTELIEKLLRYTQNRMDEPAMEAAKKIVYQLSHNFSVGENIHGDRYDYVTQLTLELPIKRTGSFEDKRIRGQVSPSQIALDVTGRTKESFRATKESSTEVVIGYDDVRTDIILQGNAKNSGNVSKPKRDPAGLSERNPSDKEFEIVVDEVEKVLERLLSGF